MRSQPINQINEKAITVWRINASIRVIFLWLIFIGHVFFTFIFHWPYWLLLISFGLIILLSLFLIILLPSLRWKRWRYEVFEEEIDIQHGLFIIKRTLIPMVRVQHVDTEQGPILRKYNLATLTISTAATVHEIPALIVDEADQLRDTISKLARVNENDI